MSARTSASVSGLAVTAWFIVVALACVGVLGWGASGAKPADGNLAYQFGADLPLAGVLAGAVHLLFRHRLPGGFGWLGFGLIFASLMGASVMASSRQQRELRAVAGEVSRTVAALQSSVASGTALPSNMPQSPAGTTDAQKMGALLNSMVNRSLTERRNYEAELDAVGWTRVLDGPRLQQDRSFAESEGMFERARAVMAKYRSRSDEVFTEMRREIEGADLGSEAKRGMLTGFDKASERGRATALQGWTMEAQILSEIEAAARHVHANRTGWTVENGQLAFLDQAGLDRYNTFMERVQALAAQQQKLQGDALQRSRESLSKLGD